MQNLKERIQKETKSFGRGVIKVDSFLNHQIDPELMGEIGSELARRLEGTHPTKILTVETGGIAPALATAAALRIPLVVARKRRAAGMPRELLQESTLSQTRHEAIDLYASPEFLTARDRTVIIDDFLTNSQTIKALARLAQSGGAQIVGIGVVIEKALEGGRQDLAELSIPIEALIRIGRIQEGELQFLD